VTGASYGTGNLKRRPFGAAKRRDQTLAGEHHVQTSGHTRIITNNGSVRHDPAAPTVILSPHLDDAVLSAFAVLAGAGEVLVVNVCDAIPRAGRASDWTRLCGGHDDAEQMRRRHDEDRAALDQVRREAIGLGLLETDEREPEATPGRISERASGAVPAASRLLAPLGMGSQPDHLASRDAALALSANGAALPLELYADMPYAIRVGWPPWVSGGAPDPNVDPDVPWERALRRLPLARPQLQAVVTPLDETQRAAKARALACYASQIPALAGGPHRCFTDEALSFEVRWAVKPTG
jgi:hypothetical protein